MTSNAKTLLAKAFAIESFEIPDYASIESFDRWDSLGHMQLIVLLEAFFARPLESEEILSIIDLQSLDRLLRTKTDL